MAYRLTGRGPELASRVRGGLVIVTLALACAGLSFLTGAQRWDGLSPSPYKYVVTPPGIQNGGTPSPVSGMVGFTNGVSDQTQIYTPDLQAQMLFPSGAFPPDAAGHAVTVSMTPEAPPSLAPLFAYGNAYVITATYTGGGPVPEPWTKPVQVYLLFPANVIPDGLYEIRAGKPVKISPTVDVPSNSVQGQTDHSGTFVSAGPTSISAAQQASQRSGATIIAFVVVTVLGLAVLGAAGWYVFLRRR